MIELKAKDFCDILSLTTRLLPDDVVLDFGGRLRIDLQDPAHVVMVSMEIRKSLFKSYSKIGRIKIINVANVRDMYYRKDGNVLFDYTKEKGLVSKYDSSKYSFSKNIDIGVIDSDDELLMENMSKVVGNVKKQVKCSFVMSMDLLVEIVEEIVKSKSDSVDFIYDNSLSIVDGSNDLGMRYVIKDEAVVYETKAKTSSRVNSHILKDVLVKDKKLKEYVDSIKVSFGTNIPLILEFSTKFFDVVFMVAPKVIEKVK